MASLKERLIDTTKKVARPTLAAGGIGVALLAPDVATTIHNPQGIHLDVNTIQLHNPNTLIWNSPQQPTAIFVDNPKQEPQLDEVLLEKLSNPDNKKLSEEDFGKVFDFYFDQSMKKFKKTSRSRSPLLDTDGTAAFNTTLGFGILLRRGTIHDNIISPDGTTKPNNRIYREIRFIDLNIDPEKPGFVSTTIYEYIEGKKATRQEKEETNDGVKTKTKDYERDEISGNVLLGVARTLKDAYESPAHMLTVQPPPRPNRV